MNPTLKQQLESCRVAAIPPFTEETLIINIPKGSTLTVTPYQVGKCYIVELADHLLNPSDSSTLSDNWNKGTVPKYKYYKCEIVRVMSNMVRIFGCGYDLENNRDTADLWEGWVPQSGIKILQELR